MKFKKAVKFLQKRLPNTSIWRKEWPVDRIMMINSNMNFISYDCSLPSVEDWIEDSYQLTMQDVLANDWTY